MIDAWWYAYGDGISFNAMNSGGFTFTAPTGKQFTKIEMTLNGSGIMQVSALDGRIVKIL